MTARVGGPWGRPGAQTDWSTALFATVAVALRINLRRLTTWIFAAVFVGIALLLYLGPLRFGGMTASGVKLATNSEYAVAAMLGAFSFFLMHFTATLTGDPVVQDRRLGIAPLFAATPVGRRTYLLGRFLGGYASLLSIYAVFLAALVLGQLLPAAEDKLTLPFRLWPYIKFALLFVLVPTFFVGAVSFALGTLSGSMKTVYIAVTGLLVAWFLIVGALGDEHLRWLAYIEPSGQAWLAEKVAKNRGNAWLNEHAIRPDLGLLVNRAVLVLAGLGALALTLARWRGTERDAEFAGEVSESRVARLLRWARGGQRTIADTYTQWSGAVAVPRVEPAGRGLGTWTAQFAGSLSIELRLLAAERSLWIMVPMIMLLAGVDSVSHAGPFNVRIYPVSSEFAQQMVPTLLLLLAGTTIFYSGEVFQRDDDTGLRAILYASPIANSALLGAKFAAMLLLSAAMMLLTVATALVSQAVQWYWIDGRFYLDLEPYGPILARVLLPAVVILCGSSLAVNVLVRGRYLAYFTSILLGAGAIWLLIEGRRALYLNPFAIGHWAYSDLLGLGPYTERLDWHHAYWACVIAALLAAACWLLERTQGGWRLYLSGFALRARPWGPALFVLCALGALWTGLEIDARGNVRGSRAELERTALDLEDRWLSRVAEPRLAYSRIDIDVELDAITRRVEVRGTLELENPSPVPLERAVFTVDPLFDLRRFELQGAGGAPRRDGGLLEVELQQPLAPGGRLSLELDWGGVVGPGWSAEGGGQGTFLHRDATFLSYYEGHLVPLPGIDLSLFLSDRERRRRHGRASFAPLKEAVAGAYVPSLFGSDRPFQLEARILAPAGQSVLCAGELIAREPEGGRERFTYRTREAVAAFAILAADYATQSAGDDEIHYHAEHTYNLDTISAALVDGRRVFSAAFGPYPHRLLRIAEFPRLATFAQSYPTLMPYSEAIGFLTNHKNDPRHVNPTYFVTAHEIAHQWWGYLASPGMLPGSQVLSESLAEYSAMLLIDELRGERERLVFLKQEEDAYLRRRDPDTELPLARLQLEGQEVWYNKGGLVFYMLERQIGRERLCAALASFVARWRSSPAGETPRDETLARAAGHPGIADLLDELRASQGRQSLDWFYEQWFEQVIVPDMAFVSTPLLRDEGGSWSVEFTATNLGTGRLPVRIEAVRGSWRPDRFGALAEGEFEHGEPLLLWLEPGQTARGVVASRFRPEALVIDRLFETIDFDRTNNVSELGSLDPAAVAPAGLAPSRR
jgi:ABC-2 type transport system permease protein